MAGDASAHEAAIKNFTPDTFPIQEWVPLMAQQMADISPSRWDRTAGWLGGWLGGWVLDIHTV